jgi:hypothetical protein
MRAHMPAPTQLSLIRRLVHVAWCGARGGANRSVRSDGGASPVLSHIDWHLIQSGSGIDGRRLLTVLKGHGMLIVPLEPSRSMLDASLHYTDTAGPLTKTSKHRGRLRAAIDAGAKSLWPFLFTEKS